MDYVPLGRSGLRISPACLGAMNFGAPAGTAVYAVAPGKVSYGSPTDVAENGGIVVVESAGRNFGYWHVAPAVQPETIHLLGGSVAANAVGFEDRLHVAAEVDLRRGFRA